MFRGASAAGNQRRAPTRLRPLAHTSQTASETLTSAAFLESCRGADRPGLACRLPSRPRRRNSVIAPRACGIVSALWTLIDGTEHLKVRDVDAPNGEHRDRRKLALAELVAQSLGHLSFGDYSCLRCFIQCRINQLVFALPGARAASCLAHHRDRRPQTIEYGFEGECTLRPRPRIIDRHFLFSHGLPKSKSWEDSPS